MEIFHCRAFVSFNTLRIFQKELSILTLQDRPSISESLNIISVCVVFLVRPPGFEPGFPALSMQEWEAGVIDQAARQPSEVSADSGPRPLIARGGATLSKRFSPVLD